MKKEYDFSKSKKNPYSTALKRTVTIRLGQDVIDYFKKLAGDLGLPYQQLINLYLRECAAQKKKLTMKWAA